MPIASKRVSRPPRPVQLHLALGVPKASRRVSLTASQAACLEALRAGLDSKIAVAIEAKLDLRTARAALEALDRAGLARRAALHRWRLTKRGQTCAVSVAPDPRPRRGRRRQARVVEGSAVARLLEALDRPLRGRELVARLGVTPQHIHQLLVKAHALGCLRIGDRRNIGFVVARKDDPSLLLARDEERVLSAMPGDAATTAPRLAAAAAMRTRRVEAALDVLAAAGLVEEVGMSRRCTLFRVTRMGSSHVQRRTPTRRAEPAPFKVKSDRVRRVLAYLRKKRGARIRDMRDALDISEATMNALMQYLKRRGLARNVSGERRAPYELTDEGRETVAEMTRRDPR